jgi:hypothetical protein
MMTTIPKNTGSVLIGLACFAAISLVHATTMQDFGSGSAVTTVDRFDNFDALNFAGSGTPLSDYQSNGLFVRTSGNSFYGDNDFGFITTANQYFNPFHLSIPGESIYPSYYNVGGGFYFPYDGDFGNTDSVTIETTDNKKIYGLEFLYGNGWTTGDIFGTYPWGSNTAVLEWQTFSGGVLVSSGNVTTGVGTVLGFSDPDGFDQLVLRAPHPNSGDPTLQELAMDNLKVQLTANPIPEPETYAMMLAGLGLLGFIARRGKREAA